MVRVPSGWGRISKQIEICRPNKFKTVTVLLCVEAPILCVCVYFRLTIIFVLKLEGHGPSSDTPVDLSLQPRTDSKFEKILKIPLYCVMALCFKCLSLLNRKVRWQTTQCPRCRLLPWFPAFPLRSEVKRTRVNVGRFCVRVPWPCSFPVSQKSENYSNTEAPVAEDTSQPDAELPEDGEEEECRLIGRSSKSKEAVAAAIQKLGVRLLQNLEATPEQPNIIISPLSISLALSQLALGKHIRPFKERRTFTAFPPSFVSIFSEFMGAWRCPHPVIALFLTGAVNETRELLMYHLHEHTVPCYDQTLYSILTGLRNNDLQIATQIFLREGYFNKGNFPC